MDESWEAEFDRHFKENLKTKVVHENKSNKILYCENVQSVEVQALDYIEKLYKEKLNITLTDEIQDGILTVLEGVPEVQNCEYKNHN